MGNGVLNIGISGINAAQAGLVTTGHNISNASTPGFSRQQTVQGTNVPVYSGVGYYGQGTNVQTIKRSYNNYLEQQVLTANARYQELNTYYEQVKQIDDLLGDPSAGLSPSIQDFFKGVQSVAASATSIPARQSMLSQSEALVARFQTLNTRIEELRTQVGGEIEGTVVEINSLAQQLGELNQRIIYAANLGSGQPPNDLLDYRSELVSQLNDQVRVTTIANDDGSLNIFIGNGQPLVVRSDVATLRAQPAREDVSRIVVAISLPTGGGQELPDAAFSGGKLSGLLNFRRESLDAVQNGLGRVAIGITETFNAQHKLGQDLDGTLGTNYFAPLAGRAIYPNAPANSGSALIDVPITNVADLTTSDYSLTYTAANTFQLVRKSDGQVWTASGASPAAGLAAVLAAAPPQGFSMTLSGTPTVGDSFSIQPTRAGADQFAVAIKDPRLIAAAAPIRTSATNANTGTGSISQGVVSSAANLAPPPALSLPATLTYNAGSVSGFPAGFPITVTQVDGTVVNYPLGGSITYSDGAQIAFGGISVAISGTPKDGDTFTVERNPGGVSDSRNAVLLGALQQAKTLVGGSASYGSTYAQLVAEVGAQTREVQVTSQSQKVVAERAFDSQQALSGVNLDEEAANLIRYQQAYQAAGKVMQIASSLFDEILALGR
ncbi:flagellar hook-associated protein FlgK [Niveibacterium sp. 24ML]|uniref:flagellar hook-associated protein FlgK n=1 Tax=Niveibacterium sp. 24ML TaxID=2985512 RepID=UPI00226E1264|nr:flagellar hook-associated protein FlgK [Niveibacterium sp. 24ML]MCX9157950.1 flagellar hook-associated protein FlgK [Niveibacterium sp. 24ML]